jgi:RimJ/RimL family protein N-acetyltransferase
MRLVSLYEGNKAKETAKFLWQLLLERPPEANISHEVMPTWEDHLDFIRSKPYRAWYLIEDSTVEKGWVGAIYLTKRDEIGLSLAEAYRGLGIGTEAVKQLIHLHPRPRYLANVSTFNLRGQHFWLKQGFCPLQVTYELTLKA